MVMFFSVATGVDVVVAIMLTTIGFAEGVLPIFHTILPF